MSSLTFHFEDEMSQLKLLSVLQQNFKQFSEIVILCIGTDRSAGDSLGPLVGTLIQELTPSARVYGTLDHPVHAQNLDKAIQAIEYRHPHAFVLAIDASLGKQENVGKICFKNEPLAPGSGVQKKLPKVGNACITGVVNIGGFMEYMVLQNTRLNTTFRLAKVISGTISQALIAQNSFKSVAATAAF